MELFVRDALGDPPDISEVLSAHTAERYLRPYMGASGAGKKKRNKSSSPRLDAGRAEEQHATARVSRPKRGREKAERSAHEGSSSARRGSSSFGPGGEVCFASSGADRYSSSRTRDKAVSTSASSARKEEAKTRGRVSRSEDKGARRTPVPGGGKKEAEVRRRVTRSAAKRMRTSAIDKDAQKKSLAQLVDDGGVNDDDEDSSMDARYAKLRSRGRYGGEDEEDDDDTDFDEENEEEDDDEDDHTEVEEEEDNDDDDTEVDEDDDGGVDDYEVFS